MMKKKRTSTKKTKKTKKTSTKKTKKTSTKKTKRAKRAPAGFKPLRDTPSRAEENIRERLQGTASQLGEGRVAVHRYKDGQVDGEISFSVPRGVTEDQMYRRILDAFGQTPGHIGTGYWLSVGQRYSVKEGEEIYRRHKGMNEIATYFAGMRRSGIVAATFGAARDMMTPGARKKFGRKAEQVFVRIHWNPHRDKPER